ncbi:putative phage baseplate assembly protein [Couchioplanes caeruleus]|nr:putative phage baseplate assembly protein [Couchioplanes caeruleus]
MNPPPATDPRRAAELRAYLRRLAPVLTPQWEPTAGRDDFGSALQEIAARLAEETTVRLDRTAGRDALAFVDFLGLPPDPPHAATGVLILVVADNHPAAVQMAARTQITTDAGQSFETTRALRAVPGRIADLIAVDPATDRIEPAPAEVVLPEPPVLAPGYQVVTFAAAASQTVQLSPAVGLAAGDLLRIGTAAYRVADADKNGLVTLLDPLQAAAPAESAVTRIGSLESFALRDLQSHALYIGHKDLFNLNQPATITLAFAPPSLAGRLTGLDIDYAIWGTRDGAAGPGWQPLDLLGTQGCGIRLAKSWPGSTGELKIGGRRSRWVRARLRTSMSGRSRVIDAASQISVGVATPAGSRVGTGSRTIARAAHNNTPLSTTKRFLPFGPEPLRFDEFALAAPEALTKKGATVTLDVTLSEASLTSFDITETDDPTVFGGYGTSGTGYLESITLGPGDFQWHELRPADGQGRPLLLATPPAAAGVTGASADVVVIREANGDRWAARLTRADGSLATGWQKMPPLAASAPAGRLVLAPVPAGTVGVTAILLDVSDGGLRTLQLDDRALVRTEWMSPSAAAGPRLLAGTERIFAVQGAGWPARPQGNAFEIVALDQDGAFWLGTAAGVSAGLPLVLTWRPLATRPAATLDARPVVTRYDAGDGRLWLWIAYAGSDGELHGLVFDGDQTEHIPVGRSLVPGTALHSNPSVLGADRHPVTVALGPESADAEIWLGANRTVHVPLPAVPTARPPLLLRTGAAAAPLEIVVPGIGERVFRSSLSLPVADYALHDGVGLDHPDTAHWLEITDDPTDPTASAMVELPAASRRIKIGNLRTYQVDGASLTPGQTLRFWRLIRVSDAARTASFDTASNRRLLHLHPGDTVTKPGHSLIIGNASYPVDAINGKIATLRLPVLGTDAAPRYRPARVLAMGPVTEEDLGTLVELGVDATLEPSAELRFGGGADPGAQRAAAQQNNATALWVRLSKAWRTRPPDAGRAVIVRTAGTPVWTADAFARGYQNPELSWEYFTSQGWRALETGFVDLTRNLSTGGTITFVVPEDLTTTEIGGTQDYWIRTRLIGGDYGRPRYVVNSTTVDGRQIQSVTVDNSELHPPEIVAIEARFELATLIAPDAVLVENNLDVRDETDASAAATARFELFQGVTALDPAAAERAIYLGLTASPGQGSLVVLADVADQAGTGPVRVDLRTADGWRPVSVDDGTRALRGRGLLTMTLDVDPVLVRLFGRDRVWLRLRPEVAGSPEPWAPIVDRLLVNAVGITHARTVVNEVVGSSVGEPCLTLALAETPVLPDTVELRVRESLGDEEQALLTARAGAVPAILSDLELLPGTWVLWTRVDSLIGQDGDARVYLLDPGSGRVRFGDGRTGKIPPAGRDNIRCFGYQQGGGAEGNQPAWKAAKLASAVEGVDTVQLPIDTAGGFAAPPPESLMATAAHRIRHAGRALSIADLEALTVASSADIVRARCAGPAGPRRPIRVTIAVRGGARCPVPTLAQRAAVAATLRAAGWGGLGADSIAVTGPVFVPVAVRAHLVAPADRLAEVERAADDALTTLFDPIAGGPDGTGWPFGRRPVPADLLRTLSTIAGVDRVESVEITPRGGVSLDRMPADGLACAEVTDIAVVVDPLESTS